MKNQEKQVSVSTNLIFRVIEMKLGPVGKVLPKQETTQVKEGQPNEREGILPTYFAIMIDVPSAVVIEAVQAIRKAPRAMVVWHEVMMVVPIRGNWKPMLYEEYLWKARMQ
jgi:hypothetical protein